ncbi:orotate phosphoribosyltransferase [Candidatus Pacearchaeota archaeon]|nr:orotate phosphoribosyltransferase [Candidatus Pacearchaeota archaeon]
MVYGKEIAEAGLEIGAIKLRPDDPFTWASGFRMPIYNDNRMFLFYPEHRKLLVRGFENLLESEHISHKIIAGTSTAGISPATTLADYLNKPLIYVRDKPKGHGLKNQIEGIDVESNLQGKRVVLVEDLISTGGSSARAVQAIRDANGGCDYCVSIFNYGLDAAKRIFKGRDSFDRGGDRGWNKLEFSCNVESLLDYDILIRVAKETGYINKQQVKMLDEWRVDPFGWGEKHGFPKIER